MSCLSPTHPSPTHPSPTHPFTLLLVLYPLIYFTPLQGSPSFLFLFPFLSNPSLPFSSLSPPISFPPPLLNTSPPLFDVPYFSIQGMGALGYHLLRKKKFLKHSAYLSLTIIVFIMYIMFLVFNCLSISQSIYFGTC